MLQDNILADGTCKVPICPCLEDGLGEAAPKPGVQVLLLGDYSLRYEAFV